VYILASRRNGTLYVGVTSDLARRVWQHRVGEIGGFARTYRVERLVFAEFHETMTDAIVREKQIKKWRRAWKRREGFRVPAFAGTSALARALCLHGASPCRSRSRAP
jgi:putative endonuclease